MIHRQRSIAEQSHFPSQTQAVPFWRHLQLTVLTATFRASRDCRLPEFKGSTFRGAFGHSLKELACHRRCGLCEHACQVPDSCAFSGIFESQSNGGRNPVMPFLMKPPITTQERFREGDTLELGITLVGVARTFLPWIVWTLGRMGQQGLGTGRVSWDLVELDAETPDGLRMSVLESFDHVPAVMGGDIVDDYPQFDECVLEFMTPAQIRRQGKDLKRLDPETLVKRLNGRIGDLVEVQCGHKPIHGEFRETNRQASAIRVVEHQLHEAPWERYSSRGNRRHNIFGLKGHIRLANIPPAIAPLLILGEHVHIGNSVAFGMGWYRLKVH